MDICQREGLHQVDLLSPAPDRISPQEYYAKQRGQQNLDIANMELMIEGICRLSDKTAAAVGIIV